MKKRTKEEAIEKDPVVYPDVWLSVRLRVIRYLFVQVWSDKKMKKTTYVYDKKKLRETDASSYVSRSLSLSLSLSPSLQKEGWTC